MKIFIVSMALCIMGTAAMVFGWDMNNYYYLQTHLKALCESSAAAAAVSFNDEVFETDGDIVFYSNELDEFVNYFVTQAAADMKCFSGGTITVEEIVPDNEADRVSICISYTSDYDMFRSPFKEQKKIVHMSCYEWISYEEDNRAE